MIALDAPIIILTRPRDRSEAFARLLRDRSVPYDVLISPAFELVPTGEATPDFDCAIFTSKAGVQFAPEGKGRMAYCVGDQTAHSAQQAGYIATSASGSANDLIEMILKARPAGRLLHLRGETAVGDVRGTLAEAGLNTSESVIYRKDIRAPSDALRDAAAEGRQLLLPIFSAETVSIIEGWKLDLTQAQIVAISDAVAQAAARLDAGPIHVSSLPDQASVLESCVRIIA